MRALKKLKQEQLVFFDIETAPLVPELKLDTPLFDSWSYKANKTGEKTDREVVESYQKEAGLYPEFAKIVSIVVGKIVDNKIVLITFDKESEVDLLNDFNKLISRNSSDTLTGFVNVSFDTPFIFKRMLINGIQPHDLLDSSGLKPWEVEEVDLGVLWKGNSFSRASLINIAVAFGLPSPKEDISGADVGRVYWEEGEEGLKRISRYCREDVKTTINIFKKMRLEEPLEVAGGTSRSLTDENIPFLDKLFKGGDYKPEDKKALITLLRQYSEEDREKAFVLLDSLSSTAKGKKTKITKAHIRAIKKELVDE
jgi:DNA polymerase elongation subunit (family B)